MAHHKRGRPKNRRSGCLMCKPHKANGAKGGFNSQTRQEQLSRVDYAEEVFEYHYWERVDRELGPPED